jgi:hypothetical protein
MINRKKKWIGAILMAWSVIAVVRSFGQKSLTE